MTETKKFENERYLYGYAHVYDPYTFSEPKIGEMGYFTDNMRAFDNLNDPNLYYVYGELADYNADCEGHYYIDGDIDDDYYYEGRYYCEGAEYVDAWLDEVSLDGNYAFYIPENSIPQEKREWYRSHACNVRQNNERN